MPDNRQRTYFDLGIKPDVLSVITILTALETWFLNNLGKTNATAMVHQTQVDTLDTPGTLATYEAEDFTPVANTTVTLLSNIIEHVARPLIVTKSSATVAHYSGENELARQTMKALKSHGNAQEFDLVRSTLVSGASGTIPKMNGIVAAISKASNTSLQASGTALSASIVNGIMKANWDNSNGDTATDLFVGSFLRNVIDGFTQKTNQLVSVPVNTIDNTIEYYQTSFGKVAVHVHRYVYQSGDQGRVLGVRPETLRVAYLNKPYVDELAHSGAYTFRSVIADLTLEVKNQDPNFWHYGFDID